MITSNYGGERKGTTFAHNGDYSGDVFVSRNSDLAEGTLHHREHAFTMKVPFEDMKDFVLDYLRRKLVVELENASHNELEGILLRLQAEK